METSDSEYFESADEDIESDAEDHQKLAKSTGGQHKVIEPELCKLKLKEEEGPEETAASHDTACSPRLSEQPRTVAKTTTAPRETQKTEQTEDPPEPAALQKAARSSRTAAKTTTVPREVKKTEQEESTASLKTVSSPSLSDQPRAAVETTTQPETGKTDQNDAHKPVSKTTTVEVPKSSETSPVQTQAGKEPETENLWDDDELDWGSEAEKETKQESAGWDDFDADWDSSNSHSQSRTVLNNSDTLKQSSTQENLWEEDGEWEPLEKPPPSKSEDSTWGTWGSWGVSSLLSTATNLTSQVSQGLSTVLESSIGIPQPEEMARINRQQEPETGEDESSSIGTFGLGSLVKFVETTGSKVITGGLDTLEAIGKKTVEVLQEGDPGLKKKRAFLSNKPNLSQILREAKEKAERETDARDKQQQETRKFKNYETLFDDHQGLVHLEALEMLSKLCSIKLENLNNSLSGDSLRDMQETLEQVKELCELPEDEEDSDKVSLSEARETVSNAIKEVDIPITYGKFFAVCDEANHWLDTVSISLVDAVDIHQQAIDTLAQLTAICTEQFHKAGELLMVKEHRSTADEADSLVQITNVMKQVILQEAERFTEKLSSFEVGVNDHITNIFFEAGNSTTYIQDAFQLLIPVLQVGAI